MMVLTIWGRRWWWWWWWWWWASSPLSLLSFQLSAWMILAKDSIPAYCDAADYVPRFEHHKWVETQKKAMNVPYVPWTKQKTLNMWGILIVCTSYINWVPLLDHCMKYSRITKCVSLKTLNMGNIRRNAISIGTMMTSSAFCIIKHHPALWRNIIFSGEFCTARVMRILPKTLGWYWDE